MSCGRQTIIDTLPRLLGQLSLLFWGIWAESSKKSVSLFISKNTACKARDCLVLYGTGFRNVNNFYAMLVEFSNSWHLGLENNFEVIA